MSFAYNDATLVIKHNTMAYNKLSESGEKYAQNKHCLQTKTVQNSAEQICWWILIREDSRRWTFYVIMDYRIQFWPEMVISSKKKNILMDSWMMVSLTKKQLFASQDIN